jgi:tetratricopeptide (TPR) repeat protein
MLGVFYGAVDLDVLRVMTGWEKADVSSLAGALIETGLATRDPYDHLTLNPALCPYLRGQMDAVQISELTARWGEAMRGYIGFLGQSQSTQQAELVATLTVLELPNFFALLEQMQRAGDAGATINLATSLFDLLQFTGKPRLLEQVFRVRDAAAVALGATWNHASFQAHRTRIDEQLDRSRLREALDGAQLLLQRARAAGEETYPGADYDLAMACFLLARVFWTAGASEQALPLLDEAQKRFETIARDTTDRNADRMVSVCLAERGDCLRDLGRLDQAAAAYGENIQRAGAVHKAGRTGQPRRELASNRDHVSGTRTARSGGGRLSEIARDHCPARKYRWPGEHAKRNGEFI